MTPNGLDFLQNESKIEEVLDFAYMSTLCNVSNVNLTIGISDPDFRIQDGKFVQTTASKGYISNGFFPVINVYTGAGAAKRAKKFAPGSTPTSTSSGKLIYTNNKTGIQVVYDKAGNYFRIEDTNILGKRRYLDLDGNSMTNKIVNGKQMGRPKGEYQQLTHFNNLD